MPEMDGVELLKQLRQQQINTPVIALTADKPYQQQWQADGFDQCLLKPLHIEQLIQLLQQYLGDKLADDVSTNAQPEPRTETTKYVDIALGTERAGGNAEQAQKMLRMLQQNLVDEWPGIEQSHQAEDWPQLAQLVHKLHGALCYCGTPALKAAKH